MMFWLQQQGGEGRREALHRGKRGVRVRAGACGIRCRGGARGVMTGRGGRGTWVGESQGGAGVGNFVGTRRGGAGRLSVSSLRTSSCRIRRLLDCPELRALSGWGRNHKEHEAPLTHSLLTRTLSKKAERKEACAYRGARTLNSGVLVTCATLQIEACHHCPLWGFPPFRVEALHCARALAVRATAYSWTLAVLRHQQW